MREDCISCKLGDLLTVKNGFAFKSKDYQKEGVPVVRIGDIQEWKVDVENAKRIPNKQEFESYEIKKGDILIAMSGATTGKFGLYTSEEKAYQNQRVGNLKPHSDNFVNSTYIYYLLYSLKREIEKEAYGGAQPNISASKIENLDTLLFSLPIQRAIVTKIDELFSSLDSGIADLKKAQEQLKLYRQAALKKAFEGEYELFSLGKIAKWGSGGTPSRRNEEFFKGEIPWLKTGELGSKFVEDAEEKITPEAIRKSSAKIFPSGSVGIAMYGATIGKCSIFKAPLSTNQACAVAQPSELITSEFLYYYLISQKHDFIQKGIGGAQPNISQTILKAHPIPLPTLDTQEKIVKDLESLISNCEALENSIEGVLNNSKALRQSILKKAFEGKLLSEEEIEKCKTEHDYEPADILLQKIKAEKKKK